MKKCLTILFIIGYFLFLLLSLFLQYQPGKEIAGFFQIYCLEMLGILPCAFIIIGLFEVWVGRETIEKYFGQKAGATGYFLAILLGGITIGPMIVALPNAHTLHKKGASFQVVFAYLGAAASCRIPLTIFEISYLGILFTGIRYLISIPLIILCASMLGRYLEKKKYSMVQRE